MHNESNQSINIPKKCRSITQSNDECIEFVKSTTIPTSTSLKDKNSILQSNYENLEFVKSTPIPTSTPCKNKNDSGFSSFISQRNMVNRTSSPIIMQTNKLESPGTSYSSRNSAFNDEEWEEMISYSGQFLPIERSIDPVLHLNRDLDYNLEMLSIRQSHRNSPWTVRPESAPLNEEDEDSEKEASNYSCNLAQESIQSTEQFAVRCHMNMLINDPEQRNELIASKLREIADKLNPSSIKVRTRNLSMSNENTRRSSKRNSHSSFADTVPCGVGSILDLILSLYSVYKMNSKSSMTVSNSQSMGNMNQIRPRINNRSRSYTQ